MDADAHFEQINQNIVPAPEGETGTKGDLPTTIVTQVNRFEGGVNVTLQVNVVQHNVHMARTEEEQQETMMRIRLASAGRILGFPRLYVEDVLHLEPGAQSWFPFVLNASKELLIPACTQAWMLCIQRGIQVIGEEWKEYEGLLPPEPELEMDSEPDNGREKIDE